MPQEIKNKLENLSRLYAAWDRLYKLDNEDVSYSLDQIDKTIISITQEIVEWYRNAKYDPDF